METTTSMQPDRDQEWAAYKGQIVKAASRVHTEMAGCGIEAVQLLVAANDLAFSVWQDRAETDGIGMMLIKAQPAMREVIAAGKSRAVALTAIPCRCLEEAEALREVIGEADLRH